ncbi:hypothetical protein PIB30_058435 [Stylosanthes scabra]|uniref:Uncharacterized protein n=1 Tax=Stylosanthes scabra TaxID=79078 RepID=A0ABU6QJE0_9FABA|nr:hypothetical protein [Stylosanthes scabra]
MVDAYAGGALMNKTPKEAWELIESMADNNQHFKVRATSAAKGVFEKIKSLPRPTTSMTINNLQPTTDNITHNLKHGAITNKTDGIHLNNHNKTNFANHTHTTNHKTHKTKDTNHLILDKPTLHQMSLHPIMKKLSMLINKKVGK